LRTQAVLLQISFFHLQQSSSMTIILAGIGGVGPFAGRSASSGTRGKYEATIAPNMLTNYK